MPERIHYHTPVTALRLFLLAAALACYWLTKHDDDDRWKRRRRKIADRINANGGRLTVVPVVTQ